MREFEVVWSLKRGSIEPPEVLDDAGQYAANRRASYDHEVDRFTLMRRATAYLGQERDRALTHREMITLASGRPSRSTLRALRGA